MKEINVSEEILLKIVSISDAESIFNIINESRDQLRKWLVFIDNTHTVNDTIDYINSVYPIRQDGELVFSVFYKNIFSGLIGFEGTNKYCKKSEIGYWLSPKYQKKGIMVNCVRTLTDYAFYNLNLNRIQIKCAIGNISSNRIPQKLGYVFEGVEREGELLSEGKYVDLNVYSALKNEWKKNILSNKE